MCYIEVKMSKLLLELLRDIEKEIVDFKLNFDELLKEFLVLLVRYFNLLVNGLNGIVVGMVILIFLYNLVEVIDVIVYLIDNLECSVDDLIKFV